MATFTDSHQPITDPLTVKKQGPVGQGRQFGIGCRQRSGTEKEQHGSR